MPVPKYLTLRVEYETLHYRPLAWSLDHAQTWSMFVDIQNDHVLFHNVPLTLPHFVFAQPKAMSRAMHEVAQSHLPRRHTLLHHLRIVALSKQIDQCRWIL
jgi:hypothetical protein